MENVFILSLVQSISEFLPISSSAHLILTPSFMGWKDQGLTMDVAMHFGTLLAVVIYFFPLFWKMTFQFYKKGKMQDLFLRLCLATLPILCVGLLAGDMIETSFRKAVLTAVPLAFFGVVLYWVDKKSSAKKTLDKMTFADSFWIGLAQCLAVIPGVSRSGITITAARWRGVKRSDAARFSMLISVPVIGAAVCWRLCRLYLETGALHLSADILYGVLFSFIGGLCAIWFLMRWVQKRSFFVFMIYRLCLAALIIFCLI